jgi:hypothetical protein
MRDLPTGDTTAIGIDIGSGGGGIARRTPCDHPLCSERCFGTHCERHTDHTPDFGDVRLGPPTDPVPSPTERVVNTVPAAPETDDIDDTPTPILACLDCETAWVEPGEAWAHCPRCGSELAELEAGGQ